MGEYRDRWEEGREEGKEKKFIPKRRIIPAFEFLSVFALEGGEGAVR